MKKLVIVLSAVFMMLPVFASNGDTLNIGGVVPLILDLTVDPTGTNYDNLDLVDAGGAAVTGEVLAAITIATNNTAGWTLIVTSANSDAGNPGLRNDDNDPVAYQIAYTGAGGVAAAAIPATVGLTVGDSNAGATAYDDTGDLTIDYTQGADYPAGYYSDQLTIVLRAK